MVQVGPQVMNIFSGPSPSPTTLSAPTPLFRTPAARAVHHAGTHAPFPRRTRSTGTSSRSAMRSWVKSLGGIRGASVR